MVIVTSSPRYFRHDFPPQCHLFRFWIPPVPQVIVAPQSGHVANPCEYISIFINIVKCYKGIKQQTLVISPSKAIFWPFSREMLLLHSHCEHQWHLAFAKIMNNMLFWGFILNLYTHTSSVCCMVLLGTSPASFLLNFRGSPIFFFRPDSWTYLPASGPAF